MLRQGSAPIGPRQLPPISVAATVAPRFQHASRSALVGLPDTTTYSAAFDPAQPGGDAVDGTLGSLGALVAVQVETERSATGGVEQLVVRLVERVLERPADVAEVGRRARAGSRRLPASRPARRSAPVAARPRRPRSRGRSPRPAPPRTSPGSAATACDGRSAASCSSALRSSICDRRLHRLPRAAAVTGVVVGAGQPVPAPPVVGVGVELGPHGVRTSASAASRSIRPDGIRGKRADVELHALLAQPCGRAADGRNPHAAWRSSPRARRSAGAEHGDAEPDCRRPAGRDQDDRRATEQDEVARRARRT